MIALLRGIMGKTETGVVVADVHGVGYRVLLPLHDWDALPDGAEGVLHISTYVREDRFELYGFLEPQTRTLFEKLIDIAGIGPRTGLELTTLPRNLLAKAVYDKDPSILTSVKGIGRKSAEKLLVELSSLMEKRPELFTGGTADAVASARFDRDAAAALGQLGFTSEEIMHALAALPKDIETTEDRVAAALRSL